MREELKGPKVEGVSVALVKEKLEDESTIYTVYLINEKEKKLEQVLITSKGYSTNEVTNETVKTTTLRKSFGDIPAQSATKIEPILEEVIQLNNEYWVSFWIEDKLYDKKFVFLPESMNTENSVTIPFIALEGIIVG